MIYYCAGTMGATSRGVGIIKALGEGVLATPYQKIATLEKLPWFPGPPIPQPDDILIYDRADKFRDRPPGIIIGRGGDVDLLIDWPVLSHSPTELDIDKARKWWSAPLLVGGNLIHSIYEDAPKRRVLACRGGPMPKARHFEEGVEDPQARLAIYGPQHFYWPAIELMTLADKVLGERQVQAEWAVVQGEADPDGARRAAAEIRSLM